MYQKKKQFKILLYLNFLLIIIFLASSMKAIYNMYLVLPKNHFFKTFLIKY